MIEFRNEQADSVVLRPAFCAKRICIFLYSNARGRERKGKLNCRVSRSTMWDTNNTLYRSILRLYAEGIRVCRNRCIAQIEFVCNRRASYARESGLCEGGC